MKKIIKTENAPAPIGPYNQAVEAGGMLFISGQIAINPANGAMNTSYITDETKQVMKNIGAILCEAGLDYSNIVKSSIFITDMNQFPEINEAYGSFFEGEFPARETVEVTALPKGARVEISVIAVK